MASLRIPVEFDVADMPEPKAFIETVGVQGDKHRCEERHAPQPHPLTLRKIIGPEEAPRWNRCQEKSMTDAAITALEGSNG